MKRQYVTTLWVATACVFMLASCRNRDVFDFDSALDEVDAYLSAGAVPHAADIIERAGTQAASVDQWMRLTKRSYSISIAAADWRYLAATAREASNDLPGNAAFHAMTAYAYLRMGDTDKAFAISREYLDDSQWQPLADEIFLARGGSGGAGGEGLARFADYSSTYGREEAEFVREAANRLSEPRLFLDAALIYAGSGSISDASALVTQFARELPIPAAYLAYDAGDRETATLAFARAANRKLDYRDALAYADALRSFDEPALALEMTQGVMESDPDRSWVPYANTAIGLSRSGNAEGARQIIDRARVLFPETLPIAVRSVLLRLTAGEVEQAASEFDALRERHPSAPETAYLEYVLRRTASSRRRFTATLKDAFYAHPDDRTLARNTAAVFANDHSFTELRLILDAYGRVMPETDWSMFYRGLIAVHEHRLDEALDAFDGANKISPRWEYVYNRGVLLVGMRRYEDAREAFRRAGSLTTEVSSRARIAVAIARTFMSEGNVTAAIREATYAADVYPDHTDARLLLRELEARGD